MGLHELCFTESGSEIMSWDTPRTAEFLMNAARACGLSEAEATELQQHCSDQELTGAQLCELSDSALADLGVKNGLTRGKILVRLRNFERSHNSHVLFERGDINLLRDEKEERGREWGYVSERAVCLRAYVCFFGVWVC